MNFLTVTRNVSLIFIACCGFLANCTTSAVREVRETALREKSTIMAQQSWLNDAAVERLPNYIAGRLVRAARAADGWQPDNESDESALRIYEEFRVFVVHDPFPNAWTMGSEFSVVSTGLLLRLSSPSELAWVLAHEFGHIRNLHLVESVKRRHWATVGAIAAASATAALTVAAVSREKDEYERQRTIRAGRELAVALVNAIAALYVAYDPNDEYDADEYATRLTALAGYRPEAGVAALRHLRAAGAVGGGTHPLTTSRIQYVQAVLRELPRDNEILADLGQDRFDGLRYDVALATVSAAQEHRLQWFTPERAAAIGTASPSAPIRACGSNSFSEETVDSYVAAIKAVLN